MSRVEVKPVDTRACSGQVSKEMHRFRVADVLSSVEADLLNCLIGLSGGHIGFKSVNGAKSTGRERAIRVVLDVGGVVTIVYLAGRRAIDQHGWFEFNDLSPVQRAELWSLRANQLRRAFERLIAAPVSIDAVITETVPEGWFCVSVRLGWIDIPCWLDATSAARALKWACQRRRPVLPTLSFLPVACWLRLRAVCVTHDELLALAIGDVVLIARDATEPMLGELVASAFGYRYSTTYRKEGAVMIEQDEIRLEEQDVAVELDDRQVDLVVELATCRLTLGELANLRVGQTLRLAKAIDEMSIDLRYRGMRVARGSLIEISGLLGVRIEAIGTDASA
ncbi:FliM/FliN family flagellar motor switch protein [Burkholderia sp. 572]|uniref:FliM/FliN family flagellar motor switch protein n=1 Tax=Burkholderia sp. 572 TaxID=3156414 RepID=UPI003391B275